MKHLIRYTVTALLTLTNLLIKAQREYIVSVDPSSASVSKIDSIPGVKYIQASSAYNQSTKEYTFIGTLQPGVAPSYLYTLDAVSGSIISNPVLPSASNFICFQYSRSTGILYGIVHVSGVYYLATIDKALGTYSIIHDIPGISGIAAFTIDEANQRLFIRAVDNNSNFAIWTIDLTTGNIIYFVSTLGLNYLRYDNISQKIYALRGRTVLPGNSVISICIVDPATGIVTDIADLPGVTGILSGDHGTFNENDHLYIFTGVENTSPGITFLYSVDINTGTIINRAPIPSAGTIANNNLAFFRYDNSSGILYALFWEAHTTGPLSATFDKLDADLEGSSIVCKWRTFQEINTDHFIVERSDDALRYTDIGKVMAAGYNSTSLNYSFVDRNPFPSTKAYLYYRLKIIDRDANFSFSNIAKVKLNYLPSLTISPNPATDQLIFNVASSITEVSILLITDAIGRIVCKQDISIRAGANSFSINISNLTTGVYILSVNGQNKYSGKFIKAFN